VVQGAWGYAIERAGQHGSWHLSGAPLLPDPLVAADRPNGSESLRGLGRLYGLRKRETA
jgi:hypothetical protein